MERKRIAGCESTNSFSPLQEPPTKPLTNGNQDLGQDKQNTATSTSTASNNNNNNTRSNEAIFLCDSNGKFLDTKQMFSSKLEVKYIRAPLIEHARSPGWGGGGSLPYMGYIGTCRGIGYGF